MVESELSGSSLVYRTAFEFLSNPAISRYKIKPRPCNWNLVFPICGILYEVPSDHFSEVSP